MGAIRKAFKVKNAVRHPIHTATRPIRRSVRKAVVPKSIRKASYKVRSVSTAIHNPVSTAVRSLDSDNWKRKTNASTATGRTSYRPKSYSGSSSLRATHTSSISARSRSSYIDTDVEEQEWHRDAYGHAQQQAEDGTYYTASFDAETDEYIPYDQRTYEDCVKDAEEGYKTLVVDQSLASLSIHTEAERAAKLQDFRNQIEMQKRLVYPRPQTRVDGEMILGFVVLAFGGYFVLSFLYNFVVALFS